MKNSLPYNHPAFLEETLATDPQFQSLMAEIHEAASQLDGVRFYRLQREAWTYLEVKRSDLEDEELDALRKQIQTYLGVEPDEAGK